MNGTLALVGGEEFTERCDFDDDLVAGADEVLLIPAALAYENPRATVDRATAWFGSKSVAVKTLDVYGHRAAMDPEAKKIAENAKVIYVTGGSPMHLRSVFKDTPLLDGLVSAWKDGATVVAAGEAASVLCSHMVDSRGGAFTVGLDLITTMTIVPRYNQWSPEKWHRTVELARAGLTVVGIDEATALIRSPEGEWRVTGVGGVHVFRDGHHADLSSIPTELNASVGGRPDSAGVDR